MTDNQIQEILSYLISLSVDSIQISPVASFQPSIIITLSDPGPLRNRRHFLFIKSDDLSREGMARLRPEDGAQGKGVKGLGSGKAKKSGLDDQKRDISSRRGTAMPWAPDRWRCPQHPPFSSS